MHPFDHTIYSDHAFSKVFFFSITCSISGANFISGKLVILPTFSCIVAAEST